MSLSDHDVAEILTVFTQPDPPGAHAIRAARENALTWLDQYIESWGKLPRNEDS